MPQRKVFGLDRSIQNHYVSTWEEKTDKVTPEFLLSYVR